MNQLNISYYACIIILLAGLAQGQDTYNPPKLDNAEIVIDGVIDNKEWEGAQKIILDYEVNPGNNITPEENTTAYITYSETHLYVGIYAYANPEEIRASVRSRDDFGMISDDFVLVRFDTYADGRNNYLLLANAFGSQLDARAINALTDDERYDVSFNLEFDTKGIIRLVASNAPLDIEAAASVGI